MISVLGVFSDCISLISLINCVPYSSVSPGVFFHGEFRIFLCGFVCSGAFAARIQLGSREFALR